MDGRVTLKPDIDVLTKEGVTFEDGTSVTGVDALILGTGYLLSFPFLDDGIVKISENRPAWYKEIFPPGLKHVTLGFIGCIQPDNAMNPVMELQGRLAARVFKVMVGLCDRFTKFNASSPAPPPPIQVPHYLIPLVSLNAIPIIL